jgi:pyruvate kinase
MITKRKVKIIATIGPSTMADKDLSNIIKAGVNVVRINAAHTKPEDIIKIAHNIKRCSATLNQPVGILVDLPGPKMRTSKILEDSIQLNKGDLINLLPNDVDCDGLNIGTTVAELCEIVHIDDKVILGDGRIKAKVKKITKEHVVCEITSEGILYSKKGFFIPNAEDRIVAFTEEDAAALKAAIKCKADFVGLSFVRNASDISYVKSLIPKSSHLKTIAKIETKSAIKELNSIIIESYGIMVARGDLGIQLNISKVPLLQKEIISACNNAGKPVITATEMLESMTQNPVATRAEVGDVANAVLDGTDAVMLSGETAVGLFPVETVETMVNVILEAEKWQKPNLKDQVCFLHDDKVGWAVAHAAVQAGEDLRVDAILCPTSSGATAQRVAAYRPTVPVIGLTNHDEVLGNLTLNWGVVPIKLSQSRESWAEAHGERRTTINTASETEFIVHEAKSAGIIKDGDLVAIAKGSINKRAGGTDSLRIIRV